MKYKIWRIENPLAKINYGAENHFVIDEMDHVWSGLIVKEGDEVVPEEFKLMQDYITRTNNLWDNAPWNYISNEAIRDFAKTLEEQFKIRRISDGRGTLSTYATDWQFPSWEEGLFEERIGIYLKAPRRDDQESQQFY